MRRLMILLAVTAAAVAAQDWLTRYDPRDWADDHGHGIIVDASGNCYVAAECDNITLVKFSPAGETVWTRVHEVENVDEWGRMSVALDSSGNVVIVAALSAGQQNYFVLQKYTADGTRLWLTPYVHSSSYDNPGFTIPVGLGIDRWGGIVVVGAARTDSTRDDFVISRFAGSGQHRWSRYLDGPRHSHDVPFGMAMSADGRVIAAGYSIDAVNHAAATAMRYDTAGTRLWFYSHLTNSNYTSFLFGVSQCSDGSAVAAGKVSYLSEPARALFVRFSASGDTLWTRTDSSLPSAAVADGSGNGYVLGLNGTRPVVWKYSPTGQQLWRRDVETSSGQTIPAGIALAPAGGAYACCSRLVATYGMAIQVLRCDTEGHVVWDVSTDTTQVNVHEPHGLALDDAGNVYVSGTIKPLMFSPAEVFAAKFRASGAVEEPGVPAAWRDGIRVSPSVAARACRLQVPDGGGCGGLRVVDVAGGVVRSLGPVAGGGDISWDLRDDAGAAVANGVYLVVADGPDSPAPARIIVQR